MNKGRKEKSLNSPLLRSMCLGHRRIWCLGKSMWACGHMEPSWLWILRQRDKQGQRTSRPPFGSCELAKPCPPSHLGSIVWGGPERNSKFSIVKEYMKLEIEDLSSQRKNVGVESLQKNTEYVIFAQSAVWKRKKNIKTICWYFQNWYVNSIGSFVWVLQPN